MKRIAPLISLLLLSPFAECCLDSWQNFGECAAKASRAAVEVGTLGFAGRERDKAWQESQDKLAKAQKEARLQQLDTQIAASGALIAEKQKTIAMLQEGKDNYQKYALLIDDLVGGVESNIELAKTREIKAKELKEKQERENSGFKGFLASFYRNKSSAVEANQALTQTDYDYKLILQAINQLHTPGQAAAGLKLLVETAQERGFTIRRFVADTLAQYTIQEAQLKQMADGLSSLKIHASANLAQVQARIKNIEQEIAVESTNLTNLQATKVTALSPPPPPAPPVAAPARVERQETYREKVELRNAIKHQ